MIEFERTVRECSKCGDRHESISPKAIGHYGVANTPCEECGGREFKCFKEEVEDE